MAANAPVSDSTTNTLDAPLTAGAWHALLLLVLINLFNYIDRQILAAVEPSIRREFFGYNDPVTGQPTEPENAKELMGYLSFAFLATYMLTAPYFGGLATRMSRWLLIGIGVVVWSLASGASGLAPYLGEKAGVGAVVLLGYTLPGIYLIMLLTRCAVGIGEAIYGPIAPDIIADLYPVKRRGQVLAWFYAAIPFGGAIGYALGEGIIHLTGDWRYAFYAVVPPGILLGIWCWMMPEPSRGVGANSLPMLRKGGWADYWTLLKTPSYSLNCAGMTFMSFAMGGLAFWAPGYLEFHDVQPFLGIPPKTFFGVLTAVLGLIATLVGGILGDALRSAHSGAYFLVSGAAMCIGAPLLLLMTWLPFPLAWLPLAGFVFCLFFNTGPTNTITANVAHPLLRSRAFALNILIIHLLGDAISPSVMGKIIGAANRFDLAFQMVALTVLLGGILWIIGSVFLQGDTEQAIRRLPEIETAQGAS